MPGKLAPNHASNDAMLRDGFAFAAERPALDLAATLKGRLKPATLETLNEPADLSRWLRAARLTDGTPPVGAADLELARALRESIYAVAMARIAGDKPPLHARRALNRVAAGRESVPQLDAQGRARSLGTVHGLLVVLARQAVQLLGGPEGARLRQCEGEMCARLFVDDSRAGDRRWCSMASCGNRAKVAQFRRRQRLAR